MKSNDLMIWDLVSVPHDGKASHYGRVNAIYGNGLIDVLFQDGTSALCSSVDPIPLTPEILEKNGFKYDGSGQRSMMLMTPYGESGTRWNIYVGLKHKTIDVFSAPPVEKSPGWRKNNKVYLEVCGCYVHELQHALRLCGIEKDIVL